MGYTGGSYVSNIIFICFLYIHIAKALTNTSENTSWGSTWQDNLKKDLMVGYDKTSRPNHYENTTRVSVGFKLRHFEVNEEKSSFAVYGWMIMDWKDEKLKWDPDNYGGLDTLYLADHEVWQPDVMLYNNAEGSDIDHYGNTNVIIFHTGWVTWIPPTKLVVFCNLDLRFWPYDTHTCILRLGSWTYDGNQIDLRNASAMKIDSLLSLNSEWDLVETSHSREVKMYACCDEPYISIEYQLTVTRKSPTYNAIVITPASVIILMTLLNFWLPPQSGEKIILNVCTSLIISIFLIYFAQKLPAMALHTPLVVVFYSTSLYLICFSTILSVIVINLARKKHIDPLPWIIKKHLTGILSKVLLLGNIQEQESPSLQAEESRDHASSIQYEQEQENTAEDHQMIEPSQRASIQQEYELLATALDRIAFLIYCFIFAVLAAVSSV